jgi:hypothetical protein
MQYWCACRAEARRRLVISFAALLAASVALPAAGIGPLKRSPGFGTIRKRAVALKVRQPALVRLANTSVAFRGSVANPEYASVRESLLATLSTELVKNEPTLVRATPANARWVIATEVTGYHVAPPAQRSEQIGNKVAQYVRWTGSLNVAYQVLDHSGHVYTASNVSKNYNKEFAQSASGTGGMPFKIGVPSLGKLHKQEREVVPTSPEDVKQILISDVVQQIATELGNTTKPMIVDVATGDAGLDRAADFMQQDLWSRAKDQLESMPAFDKPEAEAYRQYDLGLTYEAMSYAAPDTKEARQDIFKAGEYYEKALQMNQKEKYFVETIARTRDAAARYEALDRMGKEDAGRSVHVEAASSQTVADGRKVARTATKNGKTVTVGDVIDMYTGGVPQDQIVDIIRNSPVEFNPRDKETVLAMARAKLPIALQNEMRKAVGAPTLGAPQQTAARGSK